MADNEGAVLSTTFSFGFRRAKCLHRMSLALAILAMPHAQAAVSLDALGQYLVARGYGGCQFIRHQNTYRPVFEDWLWHTVLPLIAYTLFLVTSLTLTRYPRQVLFIIGGAALLLLFVGIHNAWDSVTYITIDLAPPPAEPDENLKSKQNNKSRTKNRTTSNKAR